MSNPPPELILYAANGYNAKDGNFLGAPIFTLTYDQQKTVNWGSKGSRDIPDQLSASASSIVFTTSHSLLMESTADYDRVFSTSVDAEFAGVSYKGSAGSSLLFHGTLFSDINSTYALDLYVQTVLELERLAVKPSELSKEFVAALRQLPTSILGADAQKYFDFFDEYGTHYLKHGMMGGIIVMETEIDDRILQSTSSLEVSSQITAGYEGLIASGSLSVEAAYKSSTFLSTHRNEISISTITMGGLNASDGSISAWQQSIYESPILLLNVPALDAPVPSKLLCVSELVALAGDVPSTIAKNIKTMLQLYMAPSFGSDGLLTSPGDILPEVVKLLNHGDGFVLGCVRMANDGDRGWIQGFDDPTGDPITLRACASQHYFTVRRHEIPSASFLMPAQQGSRYYVHEAITALNPTMTLKFTGLGNVGDQILGDWQEIAVPGFFTAPHDGFVLAYVDAVNIDGARSYVLLLKAEQQLAGASQHLFSIQDINVPFNSFTMPAARNDVYEIRFKPTALSPVSRAFFLPLNESKAKFGALELRQSGRIYQAQTDGFLVAFLFKTMDHDKAAIDLYSSPAQGELTKVPVASTSIHYHEGTDTWVPYNTATIPVPRNDYYTVNFTSFVGAPGLRLQWVPLLGV